MSTNYKMVVDKGLEPLQAVRPRRLQRLAIAAMRIHHITPVSH